MSVANYIRELRTINADRGESYVLEYEQALTQIAMTNDPSAILALIEFFDDEDEYDELMFSIIHTIENFDDETYCRELLKATPSFWRHSPRWASIVFMRVLNSESTLRVLVRQLPDATDDQKACLAEIMNKINDRSSDFLVKTVPVLGLL